MSESVMSEERELYEEIGNEFNRRGVGSIHWSMLEKLYKLALNNRLEFERINEKLQEFSDKYNQALGWMYAEACSSLDREEDIRKAEFPEIIERMNRELNESRP